MVATHHKRALGTFFVRQDTENALQKLHDAGFPMDKISLIGKDVKPDGDTQDLGDVHLSNRVGDAKVSTAKGIVEDTVVASATGFTFLGLSSLIFPDLGAVLVAGSLGAALLAAVTSTGIAAAKGNQLTKAIANAGIPEESAKVYSDRLQQGEHLIMVEGSDADIQQAESILRESQIQNWGIY